MNVEPFAVRYGSAQAVSRRGGLVVARGEQRGGVVEERSAVCFKCCLRFELSTVIVCVLILRFRISSASLEMRFARF